jgi:hypothetical protein
MSWRSLQIKQNACTQDRVVMNLFKNKTVCYVGRDLEFASKLNVDINAKNLIAIINSPYWLSACIDYVRSLLEIGRFETFYIGINRYHILGNDTDLKFDPNCDSGAHLINLLSQIATQQGYTVNQSSYFDDDLGRHMNFVQPVTWVYGTSTVNI